LPGQRRGGVRDRRLAAGGRRLHRGLTFLRERRETFLALAACLIVLAMSVPTEAEGLRYVFVEWRDFTADARADARALLRMSAGSRDGRSGSRCSSRTPRPRRRRCRNALRRRSPPTRAGTASGSPYRVPNTR